MLHSCAEYLTHTLYRHYPLSEEKRPVFVYGFELSLSTLSSILSIILLSIIFKNVYSSACRKRSPFGGLFLVLREKMRYNGVG